MITEDYCSYEVAKLLKEKGFDELSRFYYFEPRQSPEMFPSQREHRNTDKVYGENTLIVPTHQMAMKWLREVHNKHIQVGYDIQLSWYYDIIDLKETVSYDYEEMKCWYNEHNLNKYEEAVDAALKYSLENLI